MFCEKIQLFSSIIFLCKWFYFVVVAVLVSGVCVDRTSQTYPHSYREHRRRMLCSHKLISISHEEEEKNVCNALWVIEKIQSKVIGVWLEKHNNNSTAANKQAVQVDDSNRECWHWLPIEQLLMFIFGVWVRVWYTKWETLASVNRPFFRSFCRCNSHNWFSSAKWFRQSHINRRVVYYSTLFESIAHSTHFP